MADSTESYRTKVKICGITKLEHARFASGAMADYIGFIFYEKSTRYIKPEEAAAIIAWLEGPEYVGVFVDAELDDVNEIAKNTGLTMVQLHGNESPEYCQLIEKPIIKAFRITGNEQAQELLERVRPYNDVASYFLFDTFSVSAHGGTGESFTPETLAGIPFQKPIFIAGGVSKNNVENIIETIQPWAVDLNSSLESAPGIKDFDKMAAFFDTFDRIRDTQSEEE